MARRCWLFKSEPSVFSFEDLMRAPNRTTAWEGVRNYQARNRLRDEVKPGDGVLFHHSGCAQPAVVGICSVARAARPDPHQFDPASRYFDPTSDPAAPRWVLVDLRGETALPEPVTLTRIRATPALAKMDLLRRGQPARSSPSLRPSGGRSRSSADSERTRRPASVGQRSSRMMHEHSCGGCRGYGISRLSGVARSRGSRVRSRRS